tara:strand:+ start:1724 stop:2911 length:1188 start_codon:yes stop_codon:yes gene_type:complete
VKYLDLVILAGGKGTRIKKFTRNKPKPLAKIGRFTFLDLLLSNVTKYNFRKIIILAGYKGQQIFKKYNNKSINFIKIQCIIEKKPLGTGGGLKIIKNHLTDNFFVINGDTISDFNYYEMLKLKKKHKSVIALTNSKFNYDGNSIKNLKFNEHNLITINNNRDKNFKSAGVCLLDKDIFQNTNKVKFSLEDEILYKLILTKKAYAYTKKFFFYDIGTKFDFRNAKEKLLDYLKKPALFLDRDNTINYDKGYTYKFKDFKFINNSYEALKNISKKKIYIFIITNQAGIAKGYFKESDFINLHSKLKKKLVKDEIYINEVKYCPYHPNAKILRYKKNSLLRKPNNLMIKQIFKKFNIDKKNSLMIGDQLKDLKCAKKSGLRFKFVEKDLNNQIKKIIV